MEYAKQRVSNPLGQRPLFMHDSVFTMRQNDLMCSLELTTAKGYRSGPNSGSSTVGYRG